MRTAALQSEQTIGIVARGVSILAVVLLHTIALFPPSIFISGDHPEMVVLLHQAMRFCVPLFLAISGFGLSRKYHAAAVPALQFMWHRVQKLVPLYLVWSGILYISLSLLQEWQPIWSLSWWQMLLIGSVDYHLYFVLLIFQCYLVYLLLPLLKNSVLWAVVGASAVLQLVWFWTVRELTLGSVLTFPATLVSTFELPDSFLSDQFQYRFIINWIFYFLLGAALGRHTLENVRKSWIGAVLVIGLVAGGLSWLQYDTQYLLAQTGVTTYALGFIVPAVMVYATGVILLVLLYLPIVIAHPVVQWFKLQSVGSVLSRGVQVLGRHSYVIFLSHTLGLHILNEVVLKGQHGLSVGFSLLLLTAGVILSTVTVRTG